MEYRIVEIVTRNDREVRRTLTAMTFNDCYTALDIAAELSLLPESKNVGVYYRVCPIE